MCVVVRLAQGGTPAWLSRLHSQATENKVGVGRGGEVPGGRRENRGWVGAARLGAGCIHCTSSAAEESQTFHNDPLYLLYLNPTLQPLSHTLEALSSELSPVGWKQSETTTMHWLNVKNKEEKEIWAVNILWEHVHVKCEDYYNIQVCAGQRHHCNYFLAFESIF